MAKENMRIRIKRQFAFSIAIVAFCTPLTTSETFAQQAKPTTNTSNKFKSTGRSGTHKKCDLNTVNYGYICSVKEIENNVIGLQNEYAQVVSTFQKLISSNVELLCVDLEKLKIAAIEEIDNPENWIASEQEFGPCKFDSYHSEGGVNRNVLFPCSNPNTKFEQTYPKEYWSVYYDTVNRHGNECIYYFRGSGDPFWDLWAERWAPIWDKYQTVAVDFIYLAFYVDYGLRQLKIAKTVPAHKPGDCYRNSNDLTMGMLQNGKTEADKYGYKFTCRNSILIRSGRVPFTASSLYCPNLNYPTGNICTVYTSWGTSLKLSQSSKGKPVGKVVDNGSFISLTGYTCKVKLYKNFAYVESCK